MLAAALLVSFIYQQRAEPSPPPTARTSVVRTDVTPVRIVRTGEERWFVDFGLAAFAGLRLRLPGAGRTVVVHLGEARGAGDSVARAPGGSVRYQRCEIELQDGVEVYRPALTWTPPTWLRAGYVTMPAEVGEVMPFRYVELENLPGPLDAADVVQEAVHVAFDQRASDFASAEPRLDEVWALCRHSIVATSFAGIYVDGDRERRPYEADALIDALSHYAIDAHYETARHTWIWLLDHPTWPTEWVLQAPLLAWADVLWSGDSSAVEERYAALKARALLDRRRPDGLLCGSNSGEPRDIVDWPAGERDGYDMGPLVKTVVSAFHCESLRCMARLAAVTGRGDDAAEFDRLAAATAAAINALLWDDARGCYVDGLDAETGARSSHAALHASLFPLAFGIVPRERVARVAEFVRARGMACSVYGAQFLIEGLYSAGEAEHALALMTATGQRSWQNMLHGVGSTITLEAWDPAFKPNLDWNHAWGAAPANLIARGLMGIEPIEPGFARFRVRPQLASLRWARIRTPTPHGSIELSVERGGADPWRAALRVPRDTVAEVHVPTADASRLRIDGADAARVRRIGEVAGRTVLEVPQGAVTLVVTGG